MILFINIKLMNVSEEYKSKKQRIFNDIA